VNVALRGNDNSFNEETEEDVPAIIHFVVFKCIGCTRYFRYQKLASQKMKKGKVVPVKLEKEPNNPYDSNAIAFMYQADKDWERIGYVISEAFTDTNEAISNNKILEVYFCWIKYIVTTSNLGGILG